MPPEIFGRLALNQFARMDPSDVATVKSHAASYKFEDVMTAILKMWGGESLAEKDGERKRRFGGAKIYMAMPSAEDPDEDAVRANYVPGEDETQVDEPLDDLEQVFDGTSVYVAYRTSRGFYPNQRWWQDGIAGLY